MREDRIVRIFILAAQARDVLKLLIPLRVVAQGPLFPGLAFDVTVLLEQLRDHGDAHGRATCSQACGDLFEREISPEDFFTQRVAGRVVAQDTLKVLLQSF